MVLAVRRITIMPTVRRREDQLQWATRPIITTQTVRRRGLPPGWATRPTIMVRMVRRPVRPPERAGNSGLNVHEVVCETEPTTGRQLDLKA